MEARFKQSILKATNANKLELVESIQELWSGYGSIDRYRLEGGSYPSIIAKHVRLVEGKDHPRGWNTNKSHERKVKSYKVETNWYKHFSHMCDTECRVPKALAIDGFNNEVLMVLEDLDDVGFERRITNISWSEMQVCISWLAHFHATFMHVKPEGLWPIGTYWHLDTRPDELEELRDKKLKQGAPLIDDILNNSPYQTFVHGDAKLANFCFSNDGTKVAAVDFQYVGGGCGMKDLAYFVGSCLYEDDCERLENAILDCYFSELKTALANSNIEFNKLEANWRALYPVAWTDFHRFLKGWSPGHWKINSYSEKQSKEVLQKIANNNYHDINSGAN